MFERAHSIVDLRRGFESLYVYSSIVEPRIVGEQDCTAATNSADKRTTLGDGDGPFRSRPVHSLAES